MIAQLRVLVALARPAVLLLLGLFAVTGMAQGGATDDHGLLARVLVVVVGYLVLAVAVNDLADEAIDRVNLAGDRSRPLVSGGGDRHTMVVVASTAAVVALAASTSVDPLASFVVAGGMALAMAYSLRPVRLADRGAVASMVLPAGYVGVPYLVGLLGAQGTIQTADLLLLGGLYLGFIGRILLKDFRDVRGDALFGKRTFLVRHGRRRTCAVSAACWVAGISTLLAVRGLDLAFVVLHVVYVAAALVLLRQLAVDRGPRRDEALISAVALVGRGMIVSLVAHLSMTHAAWTTPVRTMGTVAIGAVVLQAAVSMARRGPRSRTTVPAEWSSRGASPHASAGHAHSNGSASVVEGAAAP